MRRLLARLLPPRSWCAGCQRPWFTETRRPCQKCGSSARVVSRSITDRIDAADKL